MVAGSLLHAALFADVLSARWRGPRRLVHRVALGSNAVVMMGGNTKHAAQALAAVAMESIIAAMVPTHNAVVVSAALIIPCVAERTWTSAALVKPLMSHCFVLTPSAVV